jgi:hypothetical protein
MRAASLAVLAVLALCARAPGASAELEDAVAPYLRRSGCTPADISATEKCASGVVAAVTGSDTCDNFAQLSPCWPACFCEHPEGYAKLVRAYKPQCAHLPPCGASLNGEGKHREETRLRSLTERHRALKEARTHTVRAAKLRTLHTAAQHRAEKSSAYEKVWARIQSREKALESK